MGVARRREGGERPDYVDCVACTDIGVGPVIA
jgi:hypothetical protein